MSILVQICLHACLFVISANCIEHLCVLGMTDRRLRKQGPYCQAVCSGEDSWGNPVAGVFSLVYLTLISPLFGHL